MRFLLGSRQEFELRGPERFRGQSSFPPRKQCLLGPSLSLASFALGRPA